MREREREGEGEREGERGGVRRKRLSGTVETSSNMKREVSSEERSREREVKRGKAPRAW